MSLTAGTLRTKAKQLAQNAAQTGGTGLQLLLTDPGDYDEAILNALAIFDTDKPNRRVVDVTVATAGFRFVLFGAGTVLPADPSLDAWVDGGSQVTDVWFPYLVDAQGGDPLDRNTWRQVRIPGPKDVLELLADQAAVGQVLRLEYSRPHVLSGSDVAGTSIRTSDQRAIITLSASMILLAAATKAVQNTGNTGLPNDVVDRRSQSDIFKSRAKDLRDLYATLVGSGGDDQAAASGFRELDPPTSYGTGRLWHPSSTH